MGEPRGSTTQIPEEVTLDYAEITSIPPLPLWILLAADKESVGNMQKVEDQKVCKFVICQNMQTDKVYHVIYRITTTYLTQLWKTNP